MLAPESLTYDDVVGYLEQARTGERGVDSEDDLRRRVERTAPYALARR